jgi:hypothetical protein
MSRLSHRLDREFNRLIAQLSTADRTALSDDANQRIKEIRERKEPTQELVNELEFFTIEAERKAIFSKLAELRREYSVLVFDRVTSLDEKAEQRADAEEAKAHARELLSTIIKLRHKRRQLGWARNIVCALAFALAFTLVGLFYAALGVFSASSTMIKSTIFASVVAGLLGGLISGISRLYRIRWAGEVLLGVQGAFSLGIGIFLALILAMIEGFAFSVVLYGLFAAGILQGPLFPAFSLPAPSAGFATLSTLLNGGPSSGTDVGKAIVWSFIAGFSERFVPDLLALLRQRAQSSSDPLSGAQ